MPINHFLVGATSLERRLKGDAAKGRPGLLQLTRREARLAMDSMFKRLGACTCLAIPGQEGKAINQPFQQDGRVLRR